MASKKSKKRKLHHILILPAVLTIAFFALLFFIFWQASFVPEHNIYVSSENPKQGDTILIKISGKYPEITGEFGNEKIDFFRNGVHSNWIAFLGIDVKIIPGKYKIIINVPFGKIEKEINVLPKDFPSVGIFISKELVGKGFTPDKINSNIVNSDNPALNKILEKFTPQPYFNDSFSFPLNLVQKSGLDFGEFIKNKDYLLQHLGIDLRAPLGTKIYATNNGKVVLTENLANYGKTVVIDHGLGIFSLYLHLDEYKVYAGQIVKKGQIIGLSGNTGYSAAAHLHFSIRDNRAKVDPLLFIEATQQTNDNFNLANLQKAFLKIFR